MDLQPIDDINDDCPNYGGSPITLPPDDSYGPLSESLQMPQAWHQFGWIKEQLWKVATGQGIKVAVLDTGYTKHKYGPEPVAARSFISGQSWQDQNGHGSHCAGTVLCRRDEQGNSIGLAPDAELIVGKVLSNEGSGSSGGIAAGVRWAADQGAHVISMSLGGGGPDDATNQAIDYAFSKGCIVNAAAGNAGYNGANTIGWPAKHPNCLCCGAYAENGAIANFSSGGRELDWACPGSNVISFATNGSSFRSSSGTSMATPWGSGLLACLVELRMRQGLPSFTSAQQVRDYFAKVLKDAGAPGFDVRFGFGVPDGNFLVDAILKDLVGA
jgi:subtilisin family serine protease